MSARAQKSAPASSGAIHGQCRRALIRVNMHVSYRRVLHDQPTNDRHYKSRSRLRPCQKGCKISRDLRASLKAKRVVRLSSMTSEPRLSTANGHTATIPRFLARPPSGAIQIDILRRACPELNEVSADFVRRNLTSMALNMIAGLESTTIPRENISLLSGELPVNFDDNARVVPIAPTHILALSSDEHPKISLFLIHQLPFAANCTAFPALPRSSTATRAGNQSTSATLPVVRMSLPKNHSLAIETFPLFQLYLYVKDPVALRAAFLPPGWMDSEDGIKKSVVRIKGFSSIANFWGMLDDVMYDVIDECWEEVHRVLDRVTR